MGPLLELLLLSLWSLPVTRSSPNTTLTPEMMTFSHHLVLDSEERVQLSWLPDTQGITFRSVVTL